MPPKRKNTTAHPAVEGLKHYLNNAPPDARAGSVSSELAKRSGMGKVEMYEYIGRRARNPPKLSEEAVQAAEHFETLRQLK